MLTALAVFVWLLFGYFAARMAYYDLETPMFSWVMFSFGLFGWVISMVAVCNKGIRKKAHFIPENTAFPPFEYMRNRYGKHAITKIFFGVRS